MEINTTRNDENKNRKTRTADWERLAVHEDHLTGLAFEKVR
jgi:hypothetical protein